MWDKKNFLTVDDISKEDIELILDLSEILEPFSGRGNKFDICKGEILALSFFEPSTRTEKSFQTAMYVLGGDVIIQKTRGSSMEKGESKCDTLKILEQYSDIIVVRDFEVDCMKKYCETLNVPLINAGDGHNEHPTQAMLDLYTIRKEVRRLDNLNIVLMGDLKYGRTIHSLIKSLRKFNGNKFFLVSPESLKLDENLVKDDCKIIGFDEISEKDVDIIYTTRMQLERMAEKERKNFEKNPFCINREFITKLNERTKIMHPLPRINETSPEVDNDPRLIMFKQARYGLHTRMAILSILLNHEKEIIGLKN